MKYIELETNKFYYGSTIILLGYKHEKYCYKFTTVSSSYSLDNKILIGLGADGDAYDQIKKYKNFSVNIIGHSNVDLIEAGAQNPGEDRFKINDQIKYTVDNTYNVPLIDGVLSQFICTLTDELSSESMPGVVNIVADINKRLFNSELLIDGKLEKEKLDTVLFFSDKDGEFIKWWRVQLSSRILNSQCVIIEI